MNTQISLRPIERALLVPFGPAALAVAQACVQLSRQWLGVEPPLEVVAVDTEIDGEQVARAWDRLAAAERFDRLEAQGFSLERTDEITLWLIFDLTAHTTRETASTASFTVKNVLGLIEQLQDAAWAQLRVRTLTKALILSAPQHRQATQDLAQRLAPVCAEHVHLSSPIDQRRLRLDETKWTERSATALAAWLWGKQPGHTSLHYRNSEQYAARTMGAIAWVAPRDLLHQWTQKTWAVRTLTRLQSQESSEVTDESLVALLPASPARLLESLAAGLSRPAAVRFAQRERPPFTLLHQTVERINTRLRRLEERAAPERRQQRRLWVDQQLAQWADTLHNLRAERLASVQTWPQLRIYRQTLDALADSLTARLGDIDEILTELGERLALAEQRCIQEERTLTNLCKGIPQLTPLGLVQLASQPWQWPTWFWRYSQVIPQQMQHYLDLCLTRLTLEWEQTNWHTLRQNHLVMVQMLHEEVSVLNQLEHLLGEASVYLRTQLEEVERQLPSPWTLERLNWIFDQLLGDGSLTAWSLLTTRPLSTWLTLDVPSVVTLLSEWIGPSLAPLDQWTAVDLLALALPGKQLEVWLDQFVEEARPLWPPQEVTDSESTEIWFYEPFVATQPAARVTEVDGMLTDTAEDASSAVRSRLLLDQWRERYDELRTVYSAIDGIIALRWLPVDLSID